MSPELPSGTVTFLFTDIEGSTKLVSRIGDEAYGALLAVERRLVLDATTAAGGVPFGSEGDAHFVAFSSAAAAIRGAVEAQRALAAHAWPEDAPIAVRMGIHAGEARIVDGDYVGYEVHRAARVASAANGGQVLVSGPARALAGEPGDGIGLRDLGEHLLKDVPAPERLFQAEAPGLRDDVPPPRSSGPVAGNLPVQLTSFVGRAEVAKALDLLANTRLLTLTGPGGTGKTRLSLALAGDCADRFPDGAWFVPLAPVTEPELVPSAIGAALGVLAPNRQPADRIREHLRDRSALLVLDNFEQVVDGAPIVTDLLRSAPGVKVIVSSRAPLRVAGEQEFPVPPLSLPPAGATDPAVVLASEAGRLFAHRAMEVRPGFAVTDENAADVAEIVRHLDGLPLAIELAAARTRLLSPASMARRLDARLSLLEGGGRDLPARQRTLRGAIDWSHDLLASPERRLFARASVFAGGATIELVEEVCVLPDDDADEGGAGDVVTVLEHLAEQSLVTVAEDAHGDIRFGMLETLREYAAERLDTRGETRALRDRHARAIQALVGPTGEAAINHGPWLDRLDEEHNNVRAAIDHLIATGQAERAGALVFSVWRFWQMRGHVVEGRRRVDRVLAMAGWPADPSEARLRALEAAGGLAYWAGSMTVAGTHYQAAVEEARHLGDEAEIANALYNHWFTRRPTDNVGDWAALLASDDREELDEALAIWTRLGDDEGVGKALWGLGEHHAYREEVGPAVDAITRSLAIFEPRGDQFWTGWGRFTRSYAYATARDFVPSARDMAAALRVFRESRDISGICLTLAATASLLLMIDRTVDGYEIGAAADKAIAETGLHIANLWAGPSQRVPDLTSREPGLPEAVARGRAWSRDEALERSIALMDELADAAPTATPGQG